MKNKMILKQKLVVQMILAAWIAILSLVLKFTWINTNTFLVFGFMGLIAYMISVIMLHRRK